MFSLHLLGQREVNVITFLLNGMLGHPLTRRRRDTSSLKEQLKEDSGIMSAPLTPVW